MLPDHFPDDPYELEQIHEAAQFVLHGTPSQLLIAQTLLNSSMTSATSLTSTLSKEIKAKDFASIIERITESFVKALSAQNVAPCTSSPADRPPRPPNTNSGCSYCGLLDHFICDCNIVNEDIQLGKCRHNHEGKVILSTSGFIPQDIPG